MSRFFRKQKTDQDAEMAHILKYIEEEKPLFRRGGLVTTPKITSELQFEEIGFLLQLHDHGHWGSIPRSVALSNKQIVDGQRQGQIVSRHTWQANEIMIVTESADTGAPQTKMYFVHGDIDMG